MCCCFHLLQVRLYIVIKCGACVGVTEDFLQDFFTMYETFTADGSFSDEYNRRILYKNRRISATVDGKKITGKVKGLSEGGQLMLVKRDGTRLHLSSYDNVKGVR